MYFYINVLGYLNGKWRLLIRDMKMRTKVISVFKLPLYTIKTQVRSITFAV